MTAIRHDELCARLDAYFAGPNSLRPTAGSVLIRDLAAALRTVLADQRPPERLWRCEIDCEDASILTDYGTGIEHGAFWNWGIFDGPDDPDDLVLSGCSESDPTATVEEIVARHNRADQTPGSST